MICLNIFGIDDRIDQTEEPIWFTHIKQFIIQDNFMAASFEYILIREHNPEYNLEVLISNSWDIQKFVDDYKVALPEEKYGITVNVAHYFNYELSTGGKQLDIEEAWNYEPTMGDE